MKQECIESCVAFAEKPELTALEGVEQVYRYLTGEALPDGVHCPTPKLSPKKAWSAIWFLQEVTRCLPDHIERCDGCGDLFDSHAGGEYVSPDTYKEDGYRKKDIGKHYCESCRN